MIEFFYHYDAPSHKAKLVLKTEEGEKVWMVDKIVCAVNTMTQRQETSPKFVVYGVCRFVTFDTDEKFNEGAYLSN